MRNEQLIKKCGQRLLEIKEQVLSEDRIEAAREFGAASITIHRYINGQVKKPDFGTKLYQFLKKRIEEREKVLA